MGVLELFKGEISIKTQKIKKRKASMFKMM